MSATAASTSITPAPTHAPSRQATSSREVRLYLDTAPIPVPRRPRAKFGLGLTSMFFGATALLFVTSPVIAVGVLLLSYVFGASSLKNDESHGWLAAIGIILGSIALVLTIIVGLIVVAIQSPFINLG